MEDLDSFLDSSDTRPFKIRIGIAYAQGLLSITEHRILAEWFGVYNYILPLKRTLIKGLAAKLHANGYRVQNTSWVFKNACILDHLSVMYTANEQAGILAGIEEK